MWGGGPHGPPAWTPTPSPSQGQYPLRYMWYGSQCRSKAAQTCTPLPWVSWLHTKPTNCPNPSPTPLRGSQDCCGSVTLVPPPHMDHQPNAEEVGCLLTLFKKEWARRHIPLPYSHVRGQSWGVLREPRMGTVPPRHPDICMWCLQPSLKPTVTLALVLGQSLKRTARPTDPSTHGTRDQSSAR